MSETIVPSITADESDTNEETVSRMFVEMDRANQKMMRDQEEIERLKVETREILTRLRAA